MYNHLELELDDGIEILVTYEMIQDYEYHTERYFNVAKIICIEDLYGNTIPPEEMPMDYILDECDKAIDDFIANYY